MRYNAMFPTKQKLSISLSMLVTGQRGQDALRVADCYYERLHQRTGMSGGFVISPATSASAELVVVFDAVVTAVVCLESGGWSRLFATVVGE